MQKSTSPFGDRIPGYRRLMRLPKQLLSINPFGGDIRPTRVPLIRFRSKRPSLPFPHPWNYKEPIRILETYFWEADREQGPGRHNRYFEFPGFPPVLVTRDAGMIRAILTATGDREGQFDRDTLPLDIARATGKETLLFANGPFWRRQRKVAASPFGKTALFQTEVFSEFAETFRETVRRRLAVLEQHLETQAKSAVELPVEAEIKPLVLEMLVNCFFGANVGYDEIREVHVPALERLMDHIVRDTVVNRLGLVSLLSRFSRRFAQFREDVARFEELTDHVLAARSSGAGLWKRFRSDALDEVLRSNIKVFLAAALEATTSYAAWAISHLARNLPAQEKVFQEVKDIIDYSPEHLDEAQYLGYVLDETLRLTPSLYFLPRRATADTQVETADGRSVVIPQGTRILLDVWHANRHDEHWGVSVTGFPALDFAPERWANRREEDRGSKEMLHFGFGHGARVCPGKHLGQLEVALIVGAFVKLFRFRSVHAENDVKVGIATKPLDGTLVELQLREKNRLEPRAPEPAP